MRQLAEWNLENGERAVVHGQVVQQKANFVRVRVDSVEGLWDMQGRPMSRSPHHELLCISRGILKKMGQRVVVGDKVRVTGKGAAPLPPPGWWWWATRLSRSTPVQVLTGWMAEAWSTGSRTGYPCYRSRRLPTWITLSSCWRQTGPSSALSRRRGMCRAGRGRPLQSPHFLMYPSC